MVLPIVWAGVAVGGLLATAWVADETGDALEAAAKLAKWGAVVGGVYVSYAALKSAGAIK